MIRFGKMYIARTWCQNMDFINIHQYTNSTCVCYCQHLISWLSVVAFSSLSDVHEHSGSPQLALMAIGEKQPVTTQLSNDVMHWFGYFLWHFEHCRASSGVIWKWKFTTHCLACHSMALYHPQPITPYRSLVVLVKNLSKNGEQFS